MLPVFKKGLSNVEKQQVMRLGSSAKIEGAFARVLEFEAAREVS